MQPAAENPYPINNPNDPVLVALRKTLKAENDSGQLSDESANYIRLPVLGRVRFLRDRDGISMLLCIVAYWIYGMWSSYYVILEPHYADGHIYTFFLYCKYLSQVHSFLYSICIRLKAII